VLFATEKQPTFHWHRVEQSSFRAGRELYPESSFFPRRTITPSERSGMTVLIESLSSRGHTVRQTEQWLERRAERSSARGVSFRQ
jgi:hypothetical protein